MTILGITGHRPNKLGSYKIPNPIYNYIVSESKKAIHLIKPSKIITGMAIGYDQIIANLALELNIPFIAAVPFTGQELFWPPDSQEQYRDLLSKADDLVVVNKGGFAAWKMQTRNEWIVNNSDMMLAAFDGTKGGTANCVEYAKTKNKSVKIINPLEAKNDSYVT